MASILLGCDHNNASEDKKTQKVVAKALEKAGHSVKILGVGPNNSQSEMKKGSSKGKICVYLVNGADLQTYKDFAVGIGKYYHVKYAYFGLEGWISPKTCSCNGAKTAKLKRAHDDQSPVSFTKELVGMTTEQVMNKYKDKIAYACGSSAEELANNLVKVVGGGDLSDSDSDNKKSDSGGTIKEGIQKLLKHWDGEVECRIIGDKVYINKVREPQSSYSLLLQEGLNVFSDSVKITDVNPNTVNYLVVKWSEGKITIKDNELIKRFGAIKSEVNAVKKVTKKVTSKTTTDTTSTSEDTSTEDTSTTDETSDTSTSEDTSTDSSGDGDSTKTTVVEVPITKYKDALAFANTEWHKIKRDNGHTLECQVPGSPKWRVGEWSKVILPSFGENGFMYITRASHSDDGGDWTCNLTLQDYPPGWGVEETNNNSDSSSNTGNSSDVIDQIVKEISKFSYSNSCSDGNCIKTSKKGDCWALSDYIYNRLKNAGIPARIYQYKTSGSSRHRQVEYQDGSNWVMFPYSKSGIDHNFYTNSIPSGAKVHKGD